MNTNIKNIAIDSLDSMATDLFELSDKIHGFAELSLQEFKSAKAQIDFLKSQGFSVEEKLCGIETAFSASFGSGKPVIGILGEFDALSEIGHACGHNLLGVGSIGAVCAVKKYLEDTNTSGTIMYFGCPGEEGGSGKAFLARERVWEKLDAAITWHPSDKTIVRTGTNNSSIQVLYKFKGVSAHAASAPHLGRSALDAVEMMNIGAQFLREHMTDDCRVHYSIIDAGGVSPNVVQSHASVLYMTRSNKVKDNIELQKRVDKLAEGATIMTETTYERCFIDGTSELLPNFTLEEALYNNLKLYYDNLVLDSNNGFEAGSTDVGDVSWLTPTAQIEVDCWPKGTEPHTYEVVACGKSDEAHNKMLIASKVLAATAIDMLKDPTIIEKAKAEYIKKSADGYHCPIEEGTVPTII